MVWRGRHRSFREAEYAAHLSQYKTCQRPIPRGLNPTGTSTLTFQDRTSLHSTYVNGSGSTLLATGISATGNSSDYDPEIIWINTGP